LKPKYVPAQGSLWKPNIKNKPTAILAYNDHKAGVDSVDQMTRQYNVKVPQRRWPMQVFFNIINISVINSWILHKKALNSEISRRKFVIKLIEEILVLNCSQTVSGRTIASRKNEHQASQASPTPTNRLNTGFIASPTSPLVSNARKSLNASNETPPAKRLLKNPEPAKTPSKKCKVLTNCNRNKSFYTCATCQTDVCGSISRVQTTVTCCNCLDK
jgi:hypothetical protein